MHAFGLARIGRDVELRNTPSGDAVINLALAFSWGKKGADGYRSTTWVDATMWGKRAESLAPYLQKGGLVAVSLEEVHSETYQGKSGEGHKLVGRVVDIELAGGGDKPQQQGYQQAPQQRQQQAPVRAPAPQQRAPSGFDDMDESIHF